MFAIVVIVVVVAVVIAAAVVAVVAVSKVVFFNLLMSFPYYYRWSSLAMGFTTSSFPSGILSLTFTKCNRFFSFVYFKILISFSCVFPSFIICKNSIDKRTIHNVLN